MGSHHYKVNSPKVIHEFFEDEVVIVNLDSGCYYSTDKTGFAVFKLLAAQTSSSEIVEVLSGAFNAPAETISQRIEEFVSQLVNEGLVIPVGDGPCPATNFALSTDGALALSSSTRFEPPVLNKFSDMKELLLLDPIHDVDEKGWPIAKK